MMMSKPDQKEDEAVPSFAAPPPAALNVGSVADLERRLAEMGSPKTAAPPAPAPVQAPVSMAPPAAPAAVKGGKNALLARIMAAKEKQQQKTSAPPPPPAAPVALAPPPMTDLLGDFDAPTTADLPPPSYETNFLKDVPPPAFDVMQQPPPPPVAANPPMMQMQFPPPPPMDSLLPPPPPLDNVLPPPAMPEGDLLDMGMPSAPTATAPMFEDLHTQQPQEFHPPPLPPPMEAAPPEPDIDESILNALEPAEREAFLEEQRKILAQIEREKANNEASGAAARAMAFDQRSSNAAANVAAAYERGLPPPSYSGATADFGAVDAEVAAQMAADAELAEKLQKEEYAASERRRTRRTTAGSSSQNQTSSSSASNQSWMDWLKGTPAPATRSAQTSSSSRSGGGGGLVSAVADESVGLMSAVGGGGGGGGSGARVAAPQKSMFSCVADSMGSAVHQMYQFQADDEGNVHGVDSQGLLAMPDVSRPREN